MTRERVSRGMPAWRATPIAAALVVALAAAPSRADEPLPPPPPPPTASAWTFHGQAQLPLIWANHAVGGFGAALDASRGLFFATVEGQLYAILVCDTSCGLAYEGGLMLGVQPRLGHGVTARLGVIGQVFDHPTLREEATLIGPRVGLRWPDHGTAFSVDLGVGFGSASDFGVDGFARNKVISRALPQLILSVWL